MMAYVTNVDASQKSGDGRHISLPAYRVHNTTSMINAQLEGWLIQTP